MSLYKIYNSNSYSLVVNTGVGAVTLPPDTSMNINLQTAPTSLPSGVTAEFIGGQVPNSFEALAEAIGTPQDAPWSGSGPGTLISIMKAIYAK